MKRIVVILLAAAIGTAVSPAHAHHSYPTFFDLCKTVTIEGEVVAVQWKEPHVLIDLKLDDGTAYVAEWTSLQALTKGAVTGPAQEALRAGNRVAVTGSPAREADAVRARFPEFTGWQNRNVVSALRRIRRVGDAWSWEIARDPMAPECGGK